jgi:hypothetical protein
MSDPGDIDDLGEVEDLDAGEESGQWDEFDLELKRREEMRAVQEGGGGEAEGFELAEEELVEHTSHGDEHNPVRIMRDASHETEEDDQSYGEADEEIKPDW